MRKFVAAVAALAAALALAAPAMAGGAPGAHGIDPPVGPAFGQTVAGAATALGGQCIAYHVQTGTLGGPCSG